MQESEMRKISTLALAVAVALVAMPAAYARDDHQDGRKNVRDEHVQVRSDSHDRGRADDQRSRDDHDRGRSDRDHRG
jgi:Ni/Co efflux regulator RcnB